MAVNENSLYHSVLIRLLHKPPTLIQKIPPYKFFTLGYFDGIVVDHKVSSLEDFYFEKKKQGKETQYQTSGFEEQHLCLYTKYPSENYSLIFDNDIHKLPLIVITELRLKDETKIPFNVLQQKITEAVKKFSNENLNSELLIKWELFNSLGFNDFAIVFRLNRINVMRKLILNIRNIRFDNQKIVYSTYSIAGFCRNYEKSQTLSETVTASIQVSMRDSQSYKEVEEQINLELQSGVVISKHMLGKYDEEFRIETDIRDFLGLFYKNKKEVIFTPNHQFYLKHINFTSTKILLANNGSKVSDSIDPDSQNSDSNYSGELENSLNGDEQLRIQIERNEKALRNYCDRVRKIPNFPESPAISLSRLVNSFSIASRSKLTDKTSESNMYEILEMFFHLIFADSGYSFPQIKINPDFQMQGQSRNIDLRSLERGIENISNLFQTQIQASSYLFESPSFNLKFIGSLKTIQKMYAQVVESFEKSINGIRAGMKNNEKINFFTTIDTSSLIMSSVLFPRAIHRAELKLVPIQLDITSFYDFEFAIPYLIHEIGHHFFAKETIIKFISFYIRLVTINYFNASSLGVEVNDVVFSNPKIQEVVRTLSTIILERYGNQLIDRIVQLSPDNSFWKNKTPDLDYFITHIFEEIFLRDDGEVNIAEEKFLGETYDILFSMLNENPLEINESSKIKPIIEFLRFYRLNENTEINKKEFIKQLITFLIIDRYEIELEKSFHEQVVGKENYDQESHAFLILDFVGEILADCFMQQILKLTPSQYLKLGLDNLKKQGRVNKGITGSLAARKAFIFREANSIDAKKQNGWLEFADFIQMGGYLEEVQKAIQKLQNGDFDHYANIYQHYMNSKSNLSRDLEFIDAVIKRDYEQS